MQTVQTRVINSQTAAIHESWLVRCSPLTSRFSRSNLHDINRGRQPILPLSGNPGHQVSSLATHIPDSASSVNAAPTDFHKGTTKKYHPATTVHQQEPIPPFSHFHLVTSTRYIRTTCSTPESPLFSSRHTSIQSIKWLQKLSNGSSSRNPYPTPRNKSTRQMTLIVSNQCPQFQPHPVQIKSPQETFTDHHKQDSSLLVPTSNQKVKKSLSPLISLRLRIPHTHKSRFQSTFFLTARRRSKENRSIPVPIQENLESTFLYSKSSFSCFTLETKKMKSQTHPASPICELNQEHKR